MEQKNESTIQRELERKDAASRPTFASNAILTVKVLTAAGGVLLLLWLVDGFVTGR